MTALLIEILAEKSENNYRSGKMTRRLYIDDINECVKEWLQQKPLPSLETVEEELFFGIDKDHWFKLKEVYKLGVIAGINCERKRLLEELE